MCLAGIALCWVHPPDLSWSHSYSEFGGRRTIYTCTSKISVCGEDSENAVFWEPGQFYTRVIFRG